MIFADRNRRTLLIASLLLFLSASTNGGMPGLAQETRERVSVPESDGPPVMIDGVFTEGEWDDAAMIDASDGVKLYFKQEKGHILIGVRCFGLETPITDLFIQPANHDIHQLHASAQIGEIVLSPPGEDDPPFVWGYSPEWTANEVRWDQGRRQSLIDEGVDSNEAQRETTFPTDGFEFQIHRSRFDGSQFLFRVEVPSAPNYDEPWIYPPRTQQKNTEGWLLLDLGEG